MALLFGDCHKKEVSSPEDLDLLLLLLVVVVVVDFFGLGGTNG